MEQQPNKTTRKKFLFWGIGALSALAAIKLIPGRKKKSKTVKLLAQDGTLVEVDAERLSPSCGKIKNEQLKTWVKSK